MIFIREIRVIRGKNFVCYAGCTWVGFKYNQGGEIAQMLLNNSDTIFVLRMAY